MTHFSKVRPRALQMLLCILCAGMLTHCDCNNNEETCTPRCSLGFECNESLKLCVSTQLELYRDSIPGRAINIVALERGVLMGAMSPMRQSIVIQHNDNPARLLATDVRTSITRLAMARRGDRVIMSWVNRDGVYVLAEHVGEDYSRQWTTQIISPQDNQGIMAYQATRDFDIEIGVDGTTHMVFRDGKTGTLFHLEHDRENKAWRAVQIDDGQTALAPEPCPLETRTQRGQGLGVEPDLVAAPSGELYVAYHDADCGDLRIARRGNAEWIVALVDRGEKLAASTSQTSVTGRWPSIAVRTDGVLGISYQNLTLGRLMFAESTSDGFNREVVDEGIGFDLFSKSPKKIVGAYSTLSYNAQNIPLITYMDGTQTALLTARLAQRDPRQWSIRPRRSDGLVGFFGKHVRRADGLIHFVCEQLLPIDGTIVSVQVSFEEAE